jgi:DnaJ family protein B protein 4
MGFDREMPTNHYDVLGVNREANHDEIKRAYRALSLKWHPDRNPSPEAQSKSQEINAAYETLSDERRRQEYNAELDGVRIGMGGGQEVDINDIINMMFQGGGMPPFGPGGMMFGMQGGPEIHIFHGGIPGMPGMPPPHFFRQMQKPQPIVKQLEIGFDQAYNGCTLCVNVDKWCVKNDVKIHETEQIYVNIPPGIDNDEVIIMQNCGNTVSAEIKGDIKFTIKVNPTELFERQGMDLLHKRTITLKESLTGFSFEMLHVNGKQLCLNNLKNRTIITPNYRRVIPNLGMVRDGNVGNLIIEFSVAFPENLTEEQTARLAEIL